MFYSTSSHFKKLLIAVVVFSMVFLYIFPLFFCNSPFLAEAVDIAFDNTDVADDLTSAGLDLDDYPYDSRGSVEVINFVEFSYSSYKYLLQNFGLYLYLYNSPRLDFNLTSGKNKVQLAIGWDSEGNPNRYEKFILHYCNESVDNTLIKFRVIDHISIYDNKKIVDRVSPEARRYDISGFELLVNGSENATEYEVGQTYTFSGFGEGLGSSSSDELSCISTELETIELTVQHTNYRTGVSDLGPGHQHEINSVYFSVPNKYFEEFGTLQRILAEWWEYKTNMMAVTTNQGFYEQLESNKAVDVGNHSDSVSYNLYHGHTQQVLTLPGATDTTVIDWYDWAYNIDSYYYRNWLTGYTQETIIDSRSTILPLNFKVNNVNDFVSKETLESALTSTPNGFLPDVVDDGRTYGYNLKEFDAEADISELLSYNSTHGFWDRWADFGLNIALFGSEDLNEDLTVLPIYKVQASDILLSDSELSSTLLVNASDVSDFKASFGNSVLEDSSLVLFRFATNDYYSQKVLRTGNETLGQEDTYIAQQTVFKDFDIIQLTFHRDGIYKVIPVVSSPLDIINAITPPLEPEPNDPLDVVFGPAYDWFLDLWEKAKPYLIAVVAVLVLLLLIPIVKLIVQIISGLVKVSKKTAEKQKNKDRYRK